MAPSARTGPTRAPPTSTPSSLPALTSPSSSGLQRSPWGPGRSAQLVPPSGRRDPQRLRWRCGVPARDEDMDRSAWATCGIRHVGLQAAENTQIAERASAQRGRRTARPRSRQPGRSPLAPTSRPGHERRVEPSLGNRDKNVWDAHQERDQREQRKRTRTGHGKGRRDERRRNLKRLFGRDLHS